MIQKVLILNCDGKVENNLTNRSIRYFTLLKIKRVFFTYKGFIVLSISFKKMAEIRPKIFIKKHEKACKLKWQNIHTFINTPIIILYVVTLQKFINNFIIKNIISIKENPNL